MFVFLFMITYEPKTATNNSLLCLKGAVHRAEEAADPEPSGWPPPPPSENKN